MLGDKALRAAIDDYLTKTGRAGMLVEESTVILKVSTPFKRKIISEKYASLLEQAFEEVMGFAVDVVIEYDPTLQQHQQPELGPEYEYTFETFVVGNSNKFAHAASQAVAANPGGAYNPLFIYGESGLGKTHLLNAIMTEIRAANPAMNLIIVKGDDFTNELIDCLQTQKMKDFHDKYRSADALLMDDVQFIGGKERTQEEFFHTFNTLYESGRQLILTSDRPPKEIKTLEDRLRTRFEWGLLADIQPPDFETRIAIIKRKGEQIGFEVPTEIAEYIANRLKSNIRQMEGVVKKLKVHRDQVHRDLDRSPPSVIMVQNTIRDVLSDTQPVPITIDRIVSEVGRTYGISPADIRSTKRSANISAARQTCIYIVRDITQISMQAIGEEFGGRDHSTMVYAVQQVEKNMDRNPRYKETVEDIIKNIKSN